MIAWDPLDIHRFVMLSATYSQCFTIQTLSLIKFIYLWYFTIFRTFSFVRIRLYVKKWNFKNLQNYLIGTMKLHIFWRNFWLLFCTKSLTKKKYLFLEELLCIVYYMQANIILFLSLLDSQSSREMHKTKIHTISLNITNESNFINNYFWI